ncbi:MAG: hypothetical protein HUU20_27245 [Pirellulales bacterium]|nr:hypothetical protein [Pirellulales bacterium]
MEPREGLYTYKSGLPKVRFELRLTSEAQEPVRLSLISMTGKLEFQPRELTIAAGSAGPVAVEAWSNNTAWSGSATGTAVLEPIRFQVATGDPRYEKAEVKPLEVTIIDDSQQGVWFLDEHRRPILSPLETQSRRPRSYWVGLRQPPSSSVVLLLQSSDVNKGIPADQVVGKDRQWYPEGIQTQLVGGADAGRYDLVYFVGEQQSDERWRRGPQNAGFPAVNTAGQGQGVETRLVAVPECRRLHVADARRLLEKAELLPVVPNALAIDEDRVTGQSEKAGTLVPVGSAITLDPVQGKVPKVTAMPLATAI